MRTIYSLLVLTMLSYSCISQNTKSASTEIFPLSTPLINTSAIFFDSTTTVSLNFDFTHAIIKYSLDRSTINPNSSTYTTPLKIDQSAIVKAKVYHPDYLESNQVQVEVIKTGKKTPIKEIVLTPNANEKYLGLGPSGLIDLIKGSEQFGNDKQWMGFQSDTISALIKLNSDVQVSNIILSVLTNQSNWIFAPFKIEVFGESELVGVMSYPNSKIANSRGATFLRVPVDKGIYSLLKVVIYPLAKIPEWHQGKGTKPWFFMDEIIIH